MEILLENLYNKIATLEQQQAIANNLLVEHGKQNAMFLAVMQELLSELKTEKENRKLEEILEKMVNRLDTIIDRLAEDQEYEDTHL